ncbi:MAG: DUF4381 family protein [Clostridia bacterium]|nr:DUF4381 family protein [Deltaproteobacteria bacterium]
MDELHDIKPLEPIFAMPWWGWALVTVLVVKVAVLIALLRRRRKAEPVLTPMQRIRRELDGMTAPADKPSASQFQTRLAGLLRGWIEARFELPATDMTTEELTRDLGLSRALGAELRGELLSLLTLADETRFARLDVTLQRHAEAIIRARRIVDATFPVEAAPGAVPRAES